MSVRDTGMIWIEAFMRVGWLIRLWFNDNLRLEVPMWDTGMIRVNTWMWMSNRTVNDTEPWIHNLWHKARVTWAHIFRPSDNLWLDRSYLRIVRERLNDA